MRGKRYELSDLYQKEELEREQILKDYKDSFELDEEDCAEVLFVRGGVYDVNNKQDHQDDSRGQIYHFKGLMEDNIKARHNNKLNKEVKTISNEAVSNSRLQPKSLVKGKNHLK